MAASIVISARDDLTTNLRTMRQQLRYFERDAEGLNSTLDELNRTRATLQIDTRQAQENLRALQREYSRLVQSGDTSSEEFRDVSQRMAQAAEEYGRARSSMAMVNQEIRNTTRSIQELDNTAIRSRNRGLMNDTLKGFVFQMVAEEASQIVQQGGQYLAGSMYGQRTGNVIGSALSSAITGGTAGFMIGGAPGAAVGAGIGTIAGAVQGAIQNKQSDDEYFKSYVSDAYNTSQQEIADSLNNGKNLAGNREVDAIAFKTLLKEDDAATDEFLKGIIDFANYTPFQYDDLTSLSKTLLTYGYDKNSIMGELSNIGDAGAALGLNTDGMSMIATGLGRMKSSGKTTLEYINLLQERGIDAIGALAQAHGISNAEVYEKISNSLLDGAESARIISEYMGETYGGSMKTISGTYNGLLSTLQGLEDEIDNAMGEGYINERKPMIEKQISELGGETGDGLKRLAEYQGTFQANVENLGEELKLNAKKALLGGEIEGEWTEERKSELKKMAEELVKYEKVINSSLSSDEEIAQARAEIGRLSAEAEVLAINQYYESDGYKTLLDSNINLAKRIQEDSTESFHNAGKTLADEMTEGIESGLAGREIRLGMSVLNKGYMSGEPTIFGISVIGAEANGIDTGAKNHAYGISYVPYDGYRAILHEGERVLTASENRGYKNSININVTGNFTVREEADIDKIARAIYKNIENADLGFVD